MSDITDRQLISLLQANARESTANLARKLGVARTPGVARLARLEASGTVVGYTARLGSEAPGQGVQAFVGITVQPKAGREVVKRLSGLPELRCIPCNGRGADDCGRGPHRRGGRSVPGRL